MVAVILLLIFMVLIFLNNSFLEQQRQIIDSSYKEKNTCLELMYTASQIYSSGSGAQTVIYADYDFEVFASVQIVRVGEQDCYFLARTSDYSLSAGDIRISNVNGVVSFEEV